MLAISLRLTVLAVITAASTQTRADTPPPSDPLPFAEIETTVQRYFQASPSLQAGDIISRSQASEVFDSLAKRGWVTPSRRAIENRLLPDSHFLVRQLRSRRGTRFMREISHIPSGYDRLDRMSSISGGRKVVADLIRGKDGAQLIEYMTTTQGGRNLSAQLTNAKGGRNFAQPTRRIYTTEQLVQALRETYGAEQGAAKPSVP